MLYTSSNQAAMTFFKQDYVLKALGADPIVIGRFEVTLRDGRAVAQDSTAKFVLLESGGQIFIPQVQIFMVR
jgi:hypothetical protein